MFFDVFAFVVFGILFVAIVVAIVALGSLPGNIARRRGHPQADAITAAGWVGIASMGILWPIAFVWAFLRPVDGAVAQAPQEAGPSKPFDEIHARLAALESAVGTLQSK